MCGYTVTSNLHFTWCRRSTIDSNDFRIRWSKMRIKIDVELWSMVTHTLYIAQCTSHCLQSVTHTCTLHTRWLTGNPIGPNSPSSPFKPCIYTNSRNIKHIQHTCFIKDLVSACLCRKRFVKFAIFLRAF